MTDKTPRLGPLGIDGIWVDGTLRPFDEQYDTQSEVEQDPCGAWFAIQMLAQQSETRGKPVKPLVFNNADATPKTVKIMCDEESVPHIMAWYGAYFHGDRYTVAYDGRNISMDQNGEPK